MYNDALILRNSALSALDVDEVRTKMWDGKADWEPERNLCAAILEDAQACLEGTRPLGDRKEWAFAEAARWAMSRDRSWVFAFELCCEFVGLTPQAVRAWWIKQYRIDEAKPSGPKLVKFTRGRTLKVEVPDWLELGYDHAYVSCKHCAACRQRYQRASRQIPVSKWKAPYNYKRNGGPRR